MAVSKGYKLRIKRVIDQKRYLEMKRVQIWGGSVERESRRFWK